jgi:hypothetical protein
MAAQPRAGFKPGELANDAEVEALETGEQPAPEQAPAPEPAPEEAPPQPQQPDAHAQEQTEEVPYWRFKQLLDQNKQFSDELSQHREFRTRMDERQRLIQEANDQAARLTAEQRRAAERPDPNIDPVGAELYDVRQARLQDRGLIEQLQSQLQNFGQTYQSNQDQQQFADWVKNEANVYAANDQQYFPAAKYAADKRIGFWRSIAPNAPVGLAEKMVEAESVMIARLSQQYGGKFAPAVAQLAREWGFNQQQGSRVNGAETGSRITQPATPQSQRLQQVQNGQRLQGLGAIPAGGNAGGASSYRNYGPADIEAMSEREFMAALSNPQTAADLKYAMARADGLDGDEVSYLRG